MLLTQAVAIAMLARGASPRATRTLGLLGAGMTGGILIERRNPLSPRHFDKPSTGLFAAGLAGAAAMARLGLGSAD